MNKNVLSNEKKELTTIQIVTNYTSGNKRTNEKIAKLADGIFCIVEKIAYQNGCSTFKYLYDNYHIDIGSQYTNKELTYIDSHLDIFKDVLAVLFGVTVFGIESYPSGYNQREKILELEIIL